MTIDEADGSYGRLMRGADSSRVGRRQKAIAVLLGTLVIPTVVAVQSGGDGTLSHGREWTLSQGDASNGRYTPLTQLTPATVKNLGAVWTTKLEVPTRATAVVKDGLMFISAGTTVYSLNPKTGATIWTWRPGGEATGSGDDPSTNIVDILNSRTVLPAAGGLALGEGMVFVGLTDGRVIALRQKTGEIAWTARIGDDPPKKGQAVSAAPTYARGTVFAGLANGDWALRGRIAALDAKTGKELWRFYTIPGPGEPGHETWSQEPKWKHIWKQGGAGVWQTGAVDADLGVAYFVTGNAVPMFGGEARKGDNLYTASVLALDIATGRLRWYYQLVHHDLWDADISIPPVLYDVPIGGQLRNGVAVLRPDGYLFLFDRSTGKPLLPIEERRVTQDHFNFTSPTQPFPVGADKLVPECAAWAEKVKLPFVLDCPGFAPPSFERHNVLTPAVAVRGSPMSYSPQTGYMYAQGIGTLTRPRRISDDPWFRFLSLSGGDGVPPSVNVIAAIDTRTNKIVWQREVPGELGSSGPLTTAGGLLFRGAGDGNVEAYDARTGDRLWQFQTGVARTRGPASAYEIDGEQYVALAMGAALWAFKAGGAIPAQAPPRTPTRDGAAPRDTDEIEIATLRRGDDRGVGARYAMDEHAFNPARARVKTGTVVAFVNNGRLDHTVVAQNGLWSTETLKSGQSGYATFDRPGTYFYICKEHPWAVGQVVAQ